MDAMALKNDTPLTLDQFAWFKQRRDIIWLADYWASLGDPTSLRVFCDYSRSSARWQWLFGDMAWDEAYTRYQRMLIGKN